MRYVENPPNPWLTHSVEWIGEPPAAKIEVFEETETRSIISRNDSPDVAFDYSINCYRGCIHGCTYCFSRPTHEYLGYGAGTDFERKIVMKMLANSGIDVGIGIAPTIPGLTTDIPRLLQRAKDCGASRAFINMLRLPGSIAPYFQQRLREKLPTKADRVLNRIRDARGGKLNSSVFGERMRGKGQYWDAQEKLFEVYCRRLGFNEHRIGSERRVREYTLRRPSAQGTLFG